jgi:hypothetical protein
MGRAYGGPAVIRDVIVEVEDRNRLRQAAGLPLLSVAKEARRIYEARKEAKRKADFECFVSTSPLRAAIEDELLAEERAARNNLNWKPTGILSGGGWAFNLAVRKRLRKHCTG